MPGLLDTTDDPRAMGLLSLGLGLLNSRGNFGQALGQAGPQALEAMRQVKQDQQRRALLEQQQAMQALQMQQAQMQIAEAQRQAQQRDKLQGLAQQFSTNSAQQAMAGGGGPTVANAAAIQNTAPGFNFAGYADAVAALDPMESLKIKAALKKEGPKLSKLEAMRDPQGRMVNVAVFEDGSSKVLPYGVKPEIALQNLGNRVVAIDKNSTANGAAFGIGVSPDEVYKGGITMRGQNMQDARSREANDINKQAARVQIVNDPLQGPMLIDKGTGLARPAVGLDGKPIKGEEVAKSEKRSGQLTQAIGMARELLGQGPTGSFIGAGVDFANRIPGITTNSAKVAGQLETLSGWLVANVPRMEGPQSNTDLLNYQQMAARVGDRTVPVPQRLAALDSLEALHRKYSGAPMPQAKTGADLFKAADAILGIK